MTWLEISGTLLTGLLIYAIVALFMLFGP